MVYSTFKSTAATAAAIILAATSLVQAGELDLPGLGYINRPVPATPWKRASSKTFGLAQNYQGSSFLDNWSFFNYPDPTNGMVNYLDSNDAWNNGLVYPTDSGTFVLKVDNTNWVAEGGNRNSVRITSNDVFQKGQLLILDAVHLPVGCMVWPAFWTVGQGWPNNGEIDIVEGVNNNRVNQYTLHTSDGCSISGNAFAGNVLNQDCNAFINYNEGCGIQDTSTKSYGKGFNKAGGGVFATLWDDNGISIWFFSRNNIPADISSQAPNPSGWGRPRAHWDNSGCDTDDFFGDQTIVFDITLGGDWAGAVYQSDGCPGTVADRIMNPGVFNEAYFEINYVRVYAPLSLSRGGGDL